MASVKQMETKDGKRFFQICVSRGYGKAPYKKRWYWPDGWSKRSVENELKNVVAEFQRACNSGEFLNREQRKEKERRDAEEAAAKAAIDAEEAAKLKTVKEYANGVFMPTKEATITENTRASYRMFLEKHIFPVLGDIKLRDVSPAMIKKLLVDFQKQGYSHSSAIKLYNILNGLFDMAFLDDSIAINPMLKVKRPKQRKDDVKEEESSKALTAKELKEVLSFVEQEPLKWQVYLTLAADTGARRGELCGLQWQDVNWDAKTITIRRNVQYTPDAGVYVVTPKNGESRKVDIGPEVIALLRSLREEQAGSCISQWVFSQDGTAEVMHPQTPTRYFAKFGERYGIKNFHPHLLRHTSASIAITNGADVVSVSQRIGHKDPAVTLRMYSHANEDSIRRAGQTVRDVLKAGNE